MSKAPVPKHTDPPEVQQAGMFMETGSLITPELTAKLATLLRAGGYLVSAAEGAGVSNEQVLDWIAYGEGRHPIYAAREPYITFAKEMRKARADGENISVVRIAKAASGGAILKRQTTTTTDDSGRTITKTTEEFAQPNWNADLTLLERKFPRRWGRRGDGSALDLPAVIGLAKGIATAAAANVPADRMAAYNAAVEAAFAGLGVGVDELTGECRVATGQRAAAPPVVAPASAGAVGGPGSPSGQAAGRVANPGGPGGAGVEGAAASADGAPAAVVPSGDDPDADLAAAVR